MQILDIRLADGEPWQNGEVGGLRLFECLLVRAARGLLVAQIGEGRVVQIASKRLRCDMAEQAFDAFLAAGGCEDQY